MSLIVKQKEQQQVFLNVHHVVASNKGYLSLTPISNIKRKDLARNYRLIVSKLELKIPIQDPIKCIGRVANKANLSEVTKRKAIDLMHKINDNELAGGKDSKGLAASVL
jgi:transcription initiation factor TFIIIB Brf1 subunit/transcription initiation factor TFIIB